MHPGRAELIGPMAHTKGRSSLGVDNSLLPISFAIFRLDTHCFSSKPSPKRRVRGKREHLLLTLST